jgi:transcriptional regulator with XRE-family HTH domain
MKNEALKLGRNLKRIRTAKDITQGDIVRKLNVGRGFISNIENGKANPTLTTIAKLAKAIGVPIEDLIK